MGVSPDEGFDFLEMFLRRPSAEGDVFGRMMKIMPAAIEVRVGAKRDPRDGRMFGQPHLRAEHRAVHDVEDIQPANSSRVRRKSFMSRLSLAWRNAICSCLNSKRQRM